MEQLNNDAVKRKAFACSVGISQTEVFLRSCLQLRLRGKGLWTPALSSWCLWAAHWKEPSHRTGRLPVAEGNFWRGIQLWACSSQYCWQLGEWVPWFWRCTRVVYQSLHYHFRESGLTTITSHLGNYSSLQTVVSYHQFCLSSIRILQCTWWYLPKIQFLSYCKGSQLFDVSLCLLVV